MQNTSSIADDSSMTLQFRSEALTRETSASSQPVTSFVMTSEQPVTSFKMTSSQPETSFKITSSQPATSFNMTSSQLATSFDTSSQLVTSFHNLSSQATTSFNTTSPQPLTTLNITSSFSGMGDPSATAPPSLNALDTVFVSVVGVTSCLSIISCVVIIVVHVRWSNLRTIGRSMLVQLSVADMLTAIGNLMGVLWFLFRDSEVLKRSKAYCDAHSSLTIFSSIASFIWTTVTGLSLYLVLVRHASPGAVETFWKPIWILCWGVPATVAISALSLDVLGYDPNVTGPSWCWIDPSTRNSVMWTFVTGKAWELMAYFLTVVLYTAIRISLLRQKIANDTILTGQPRRDGIRDAIMKLMFIPLVFIVLRLWGTVRFVIGLVDYGVANSPYTAWIAPLQGFGDTAQGVCNLVMDLAYTAKVRGKLLGRDKHGPTFPEASSSFP